MVEKKKCGIAMMPETESMLRMIIRNDRVMSEGDKQSLIDRLLGNTRDSESPLPRIITREEVCKLFNKSQQWIDWLNRRSPNLLVKVYAPGCTRAMGYTRESVEALLRGGDRKEVA